MLKRTDFWIAVLLGVSAVLAALLKLFGVLEIESGWILTALIAAILVFISALWNRRIKK
ncbi:hypothetical protein [Listeria floridensis]|uniref:hypothetical protein n=1 Tax=Listeria floridensis TaxID=1494962 RepID=UPI0004B75D30|nr:hypothetical protein [Listeria floridensis]